MEEKEKEVKAEQPKKERHRRPWKDLPPELKKKLRERYGYTFDD